MSEEVNQSELHSSAIADEEMSIESEEQPVEVGEVQGENSVAEENEAKTEFSAEEENSTDAVSPPISDVMSEALTRLGAEVETLRLQLEDRNSQYMRIAADFDNFRKRTEREKGELELRVKRETLVELLPVIDSFDRARTQMKPQTDQEAGIHQSYQGVYKQLVDCLKRIGVSPMRAEGQPFDPNYHDAILREPSHEHPEGTVIEELCRGYLLGDLVLRHAMVKVSTEPEETPSPPSEVEQQEAPEAAEP
jgi:molecular chaperone GrpE